jgi:hypothetical protein
MTMLKSPLKKVEGLGGSAMKASPDRLRLVSAVIVIFSVEVVHHRILSVD